ncbi:MAG: zf-HC2 domain-containing protein [Oscillospiraceae bacterium]|nr:zf-HC2 domain-containing protein [Oscillospiraceae bacterium]
MKLSCNIIKDLLPLYAEGMVSADSKDVIEAHLGECAPCRDVLAQLRQEPVMPTQTDTAPLEHLERNIRRRRTSAAVLAILITATVLFAMFNYFYSPVYLSAEEAVVSVTKNGDIVTVELSARAEYCRWEDHVDPDTGRKSVTFIAARHKWNVLMDSIFGADTRADDSRKMHLAANKDIWYASTGSGEEDTLLWGEKPSGGRMSLPRLVLGYYFVLSLGSGLILLIPAIIFRKRTGGRFLGVICTLCLSFAISDLMATGGNWRIYDGYDVPILLTLMTIQTILMTLSVVFGFHVWRTNRTE